MVPRPAPNSFPPVLAAGLSGMALTFAFPNYNWDILIWGAFIPLFWAIREASPKKAFLLGALAGLIHYYTLIYWVYHVIQYYGGLPWFLASFVLTLLVCYLALYPAVFCWGIALMRRSTPVPLIVTAPLLWVSLELLRANVFTGFPWGLIGQSLYQRLSLIQSSNIAGVYGLALIIMSVNVALYDFIFAGGPVRNRLLKPSAPVAVLLFMTNFVYGQMTIVESAKSEPKTITVALAQGNIDQAVKWDPKYKRQTIAAYEKVIEPALKDNVDLIVWPETALPFYFGREEEFTDLVTRFVRKTGTYNLFGSPAAIKRSNAYENRNRAFLAAPDGTILTYYDKTHLVPYGEYVPLKKYFPFINKLVVAAGNFTPGVKGLVLNLPQARLGPLICFEGIFPYLTRAQVKSGAQLLVNITNDAWFGKSSAPYQHLSMLVFRCVEARRAAVRAANTGISAIISPQGKIEAQSPLFQEYLLVGKVPLLDGTTFYMQFGDVIAYGCAILTVALFAWALLAERTKRASID